MKLPDRKNLHSRGIESVVQQKKGMCNISVEDDTNLS